MIGQSTLDWPLSREEKKHRLLQLYETDLRTADSILQSNRLHHATDIAGNHQIPDVPKTFIPGAVEECTKPDTSKTLIPGAVEEVHHDPCLEIGFSSHSSSSSSSALPEKDQPDKAQGNTNSGAVEPDLVGASPPPIGHGKISMDEATSSNGGQSARSFEYLTPESIPRTPPGHNKNLPTPQIQPQVRAPKEKPPSQAAKDVYYCDKTETLIPAIPPMPPRLGDRRRKCSVLPTMPAQVLQDLRSLPRRSKSAAAAPRRNPHASDEKPRRRSISREGKREGKQFDAFQVLSCARHGKYEEVEAALSAGFGANFKDTHGNTIFHVACQNGKKRIAKLAVKYGADMDAQNAKGNTGLHFLFAYGYPDIAEYFIGKGAREDITNDARKVAREGI